MGTCFICALRHACGLQQHCWGQPTSVGNPIWRRAWRSTILIGGMHAPCSFSNLRILSLVYPKWLYHIQSSFVFSNPREAKAVRPMLRTKTGQTSWPKDEFQRHEGRCPVPADRLGSFNIHGDPWAIPLARCTRMDPYKHCFRLHAQLFPGYISYFHSFSYPSTATPWCLRFFWGWQRFISHVCLHHDGDSQGFQRFEASRFRFSFVGVFPFLKWKTSPNEPNLIHWFPAQH